MSERLHSSRSLIPKGLLLLLSLLAVPATNPALAADSTAVVVDSTSPMTVKIVAPGDYLQGHFAYVSIVRTHGTERLGDFNLLVSYDSRVMTFVSAEIGKELSAGHGWTDFVAFLEHSEDCSPEGAVKSLRLAAKVDPSRIAAESLNCRLPDSCVIVTIKFLTTNDRIYQCAVSPVRFSWHDCDDNTFLLGSSDSILLSRRVYDSPFFEKYTDRPIVADITDRDCGSAFRSGGVCSQCDSSRDAWKRVKAVDFHDGVVSLVCDGEIDAYGDLNLNGIASEIADCRLLSNALLNGVNVLPRLGRAEAVYSSDANRDGRCMTIADLVYLQRIIIGDALPKPRLHPFFDSAVVAFQRGLLTVSSSTDVGALLAVFDGKETSRVKPPTDLTTESYFDTTANELRVLVMCDIELKDSSGIFACSRKNVLSGDTAIFRITGSATLKEIQISDYDGNLLRTPLNPPKWTCLTTPVIGASSDRSDTAGSGPPNMMWMEEVDWTDRSEAEVTLNFRDTTDWRLEIYDDPLQPALVYQGRDIGRKLVSVDASSLCPGNYRCTLTTGKVKTTGLLIRWTWGENP
jgi:hypothetical protein